MPASAQYHTYPEIGSELLAAQASYPSICQRHDLGSSGQGRSIWAICITDNVGVEEDEPEFKYVSTMHGNEPMGMELCLKLVEYLTTNYGIDPRVTNIVDSVELWIVPLMNPDGYIADTRYNASGIDLNRNFPDPFTSPENTPDGRAVETGVIMNWSFDHSFTLSANYHGGELVVNYPFDNNETGSSVYTPTPDDEMFIWISKEYSQHNQPMWDSSIFDYGITNGADWYAISGGMQDWSYRYMGCNEVTIEVSEAHTPGAGEIPTFWSQNRESMLAYIETCLTGVRGIVTNGATGEPLAATVTVIGRDHEVYTDPDVGDYHRMLYLTDTYDLTFEAEGYDTAVEYDVPVTGGDITVWDVELWRTNVSYPNGGESLTAFTEIDVTWTGNPDANFQVQYTPDADQISTVVDGFETGVLHDSYQTGGDAYWSVTDSDSYAGDYAARAGTIGHTETTWMTRTVEGGDVSFWYRVSSESGYDYFRFYVDDDLMIETSGTSLGWRDYSTTLSQEPHELKWEYSKDINTSSGSDTVWIDELEFTASDMIWTDIEPLTELGVTSTPWTPTEPGTAYKVRARSYYGTGVYGEWDESDTVFTVEAGPMPGDFDGDMEVNYSDYVDFVNCFTGPGGGPVDPECEPGDFAPKDGDVDCDDWQKFLLAWTDTQHDPPEFAQCPNIIPTVSQWGLVVMTLLIWTAGTVVIGIRHRGAYGLQGKGATL
ncbi:MAG: succinylglutamate desuccinylase/aspartoacylase family protein [Phycisphaerales bacterium]|nr:MAG: succinylglutamate desuccinylase/aspartoacylase family protein [Phycisphaerales bacterium]